jgi:hypothetical protein
MAMRVPDLHVRAESRAGRRAEPGKPHVYLFALTWPAAPEADCGGIGGMLLPSIPAGEDLPNRAQGAESRGPEDQRRRWFAVGIDHKTSQESRYYADQPIRWPNSS